MNQIIKQEINNITQIWREIERKHRLRSSTIHLFEVPEGEVRNSRDNVWRDNDVEFSRIEATHESLIEKLIT